MFGRGQFLKSYSAVMTGLVALLVGAAGVGLFLTFTGEGAQTAAVAVAVVAGVGLTGGLSLLAVVFQRRGGLLRGRISGEQRATYRRRYRRGAREADRDSSRTRKV